MEKLYSRDGRESAGPIPTALELERGKSVDADFFLMYWLLVRGELAVEHASLALGHATFMLGHATSGLKHATSGQMHATLRQWHATSSQMHATSSQGMRL